MSSAGAMGRLAIDRIIAGLRDADWLDADRARAWSRVLAAVTAICVVGWVALSRNGIDPLGKPLGTDFISFWTASRFALDGHAAAAYDPAAHAAAEQALGAFDDGYVPFFYPPVFLLLFLPLALLPYLLSLAVWIVGGLLVMLTCLRRILPQRWAIVPMLAFPGVFTNIGHGQNAFISLSCFGGGMLLLDRFPLLAGMCLGGLVFKPQLAIAVPLTLLAARRWRSIAGAAISSLGLCGLSWLVLGQASWRGFFQDLPLAGLMVRTGLLDPAKMQSVYAAVRVLHGGSVVGMGLQAIVGLCVAAAVVKAAMRRPGGMALGALMVTSCLLCTPYLLDYDLLCLALPLAWVMARAQVTGWYTWEKFVLLAAYLLPAASRGLAMFAGLPIGPLVMLGLFAVVWRRASVVEDF